jgi:hypothetical protein
MKRSVGLMFAVCVMLATGASEARAQMTMGTFKGYLTGHIGAVTGGEVTSARTAAGASVAVHEANGWGAEVDFGRSTDVSTIGPVLDLTTYFVNAAWVKPAGILRPFGGAGVGILQLDGCGAPCGLTARTYDLGFSAGAGVFATVSDFVGVRGDVRYFFSGADHPELHRPANFAFWRVSVGATFLWAIVP